MAWVFAFLMLFTVPAGQARQNPAFPPVQNLGVDPPATVNVTINGRVTDYRDRPVTVGEVGLMDAARSAWQPLSRIGRDGAYSIQAALVPGVYILVAALGPYELAEKTITIVGAGTVNHFLEVVREYPNAAGLLACPLANMPKRGPLPRLVGAAVNSIPKTQPRTAAASDLGAVNEFFYVTDRNPVARPTANGPSYFEDDSDPNGQLRYGTFDVQLVRKGAAGAPRSARAPISDATVFYNLLEKRTGGGDVVVFVHGFRVPFDDGLIRVAQLSQGMGYKGPIVLFSWPSGDNLVRYPAGVKQLPITRPLLVRFLDDLRKHVRPKRVLLVAHSLGNQLLLLALETPSALVASQNDQLILVAPDVSTRFFERNIVAAGLIPKVERVTIYASSLDCALRCSAVFYGKDPRVGEAGRNLLVVKDVDTVDVSTVKGNDPLGHSLYLFPSVLTDLGQLITKRDPPVKRGLVQKSAPNGLPYWTFKR